MASRSWTRERRGCWSSLSQKSPESTPSGRDRIRGVVGGAVSCLLKQGDVCVMIPLWRSPRDGKGQAVSLLTLKGDFTLTGGTAEDMAELITMLLSGLTERSRYAVTLKEAERRGQTTDFPFIHWIVPYFFNALLIYAIRSSTDDPTFLSFKKGELILIIKDDEFSQERGWIKGENERTRQIGAAPTDAILILPTLSKPTAEVMVWRCQWRIPLGWVIVHGMCGVSKRNACSFCFFQSLLNLSPNQRKDAIQANRRESGTVERLAPATLKEFSLEYFR